MDRGSWIRIVSLVVLAICGGGIRRSAEAREGDGPAFDRDAFLGRLVPIIARGIARTDTEHAAFHGNVDWHSAVHGHWALFRIARATGGHREAAESADRSLGSAALAAEAKYLREHPRFEMPYGRAWFLRLAMEFEEWSRARKGKDPDRLRSMADEVARSLREFLRKAPPNPSTPEYQNSSWALAQLHRWYSFAQQKDGVEWTSAVVREHFLGAGAEPSFARDATSPEFFSLFGNWAYLVATTQDAPTLAKFLGEHPAPLEALAPVRPDGRTAHHLGMNWSRAWALATLSRRAPKAEDRERFRNAFDAHVSCGVKDHDDFAGDFWAYDHWVPQFAVYALTDEP